jgi:hypothetical protein
MFRSTHQHDRCREYGLKTYLGEVRTDPRKTSSKAETFSASGVIMIAILPAYVKVKKYYDKSNPLRGAMMDALVVAAMLFGHYIANAIVFWIMVGFWVLNFIGNVVLYTGEKRNARRT